MFKRKKSKVMFIKLQIMLNMLFYLRNQESYNHINKSLKNLSR